ncbi:hypothetical protein V6N13_046663 [Hibiscus sabdariffa]
MDSLSHISPFGVLLLSSFFFFHHSLATFLSEPVSGHAQPLIPGDYSSPDMVPALPAQIQAQVCRLDLSSELFGGVNDACGHDLDRSRCCPVLAAWLYAAHARYALEVSAPGPAPAQAEQPMMPDDSQKCVNSLQNALISSLSCPAAFNVSGFRNATPTAAVKNLERHCRNSSYAGCTKCLGALQKVK